MKSNWSDTEAEEYKQKYSAVCSPELALRVYTSRLIGRDSLLVLHGGGNTSVKLTVKDAVGNDVEVIAIKGSGWDLSNIEPQGFPLVKLRPCQQLLTLPTLSDEQMVNELRINMLQFDAPTPSVETLLHAFLPHKFVDHSHADAILAIVDQPEGYAICRKLYGEDFAIVPYIMPGFDLARQASEIFQSKPNVKGMILLKHGLFTFADTAKESYENHIQAVIKAEQYIQQCKATANKQLTFARTFTYNEATAQRICQSVIPALRGIFNRYTQSTSRAPIHCFSPGWVFMHKHSQAAFEFACSNEVSDWSQRGTLTPDHVIRTKGLPLVLRGLLQLVETDQQTQIVQYLQSQVDNYIQQYHDYFTTQNQQSKVKKIELDPLPRVLLIEDVGLVTIGNTYKDCVIAADIYEHTIATIKDAMCVGAYEPVNEKERFDMEYWSLEQAKLGKTTAPPLQGRVVYITGAGSGIGLACAHVFGEAGANLFIVDVSRDALDGALQQLRKKKIQVHGQQVDVTSFDAVKQSFVACVMHYGGIDILVSNAGKAFQSNGMADCSDLLLKQSFDINFFAHQYCAAAATQIMIHQNNGGVLLLTAMHRKQHLTPGKNFGPYCTAKAATITLMKQYALEYGSYGIRANAVNADRVHTNLFTDEVIQQRAAARNLSPDQYFKSNLLQQEVTASDVAQAFYHLAMSHKTTAAILTVDGGNIEASVR